MAEKFEKPVAKTLSAGLETTQGLSPLQWSDKCFLCSREIGESDPRGFYQGTNAMALCHRGCLVTMETHGGTPEDYHRALNPPAQDGPAPIVGPTVAAGPSWLEFADLAALQAFTKLTGAIAPHVKVTVAGKVIQG